MNVEVAADPQHCELGQNPDPPTGTAAAAPVGGRLTASRAGKTHIGAYLDVGYRRRLRLVQAKGDKGLQDLLAEALDDLFQKYDVTSQK